MWTALSCSPFSEAPSLALGKPEHSTCPCCPLLLWSTGQLLKLSTRRFVPKVLARIGVAGAWAAQIKLEPGFKPPSAEAMRSRVTSHKQSVNSPKNGLQFSVTQESRVFFPLFRREHKSDFWDRNIMRHDISWQNVYYKNSDQPFFCVNCGSWIGDFFKSSQKSVKEIEPRDLVNSQTSNLRNKCFAKPPDT